MAGKKTSDDGSGEENQVAKIVREGDAGSEDAEGEAIGSEAAPEEEEFEIEEILDYKRGMFGPRIGYLAKWVGYGPEENTWVDEADAQGAQELIREFWEKRKLIEAAERAAAENGSSSKEKAKPGRKKKDASAPEKKTANNKRSVDEDAEENGSNAKKRKAPARMEVDSDGETSRASDGEKINAPGTLPEFKKAKGSWETMIKCIDTVERTGDGKLMIYFTTKQGTHCKEDSELCKLKFPQALLTFYEKSLRWREVQ